MTPPPPAPPDRAKRLVDLVVAVPALVVLSPVLLVIAVAVRVDSRGPALFRQERVGLGGEVFRLHKFRTMRASHDGALVSPTGDSRVTRVGRVLRRTKLDELPQLIDVATGHMSLVGPRPEVPRYAALWDPAQARVILSVRPGITDPVSIAFRHEADLLAAAEDPEAHYREVLLPQKAAMYVDYVQHRTLPGDLRILLQTVAAVVRD
jgi:lipopolysaccharide/colanic/teichoic acid biosynthesis glycosyltransferase